MPKSETTFDSKQGYIYRCARDGIREKLFELLGLLKTEANCMDGHSLAKDALEESVSIINNTLDYLRVLDVVVPAELRLPRE
jgi:hypothetical protein